MATRPDDEGSEDARPLSPGEVLDRYTVLEPLGVGGMGEVYAAYDAKLDRKVALKLLRLSGHEYEIRLMREARAMARLTHPHVVSVFDGALITLGQALVATGHPREALDPLQQALAIQAGTESSVEMTINGVLARLAMADARWSLGEHDDRTIALARYALDAERNLRPDESVPKAERWLAKHRL